MFLALSNGGGEIWGWDQVGIVGNEKWYVLFWVS